MSDPVKVFFMAPADGAALKPADVRAIIKEGAQAIVIQLDNAGRSVFPQFRDPEILLFNGAMNLEGEHSGWLANEGAIQCIVSRPLPIAIEDHEMPY
jgi:hypothetical protein